MTESPLSLGECAAAWSVAQRVQVGRWPVRFREAGRGPAVVLAHGLGVSADYWWRVGPPLAAAGFRVLAPDLPGFGRTPGPRRGLSVPEQSRALLDWTDAMSLPAPVLVGHSLSCQAAVELAAARPDRVRALVLAAPTGARRRFPLLRQLLGLVQDVPRESLSLAALVAQAYLRAGIPRIWHTWRRGVEEHPLDVAHRVPAPALVVLGERDPVVPLEYAEQLASALPAGRLAVVPGAAHAVMFNGAEGFNRAVLAFLAEVAVD